MTQGTAPSDDTKGAPLYFALACGLTWGLAVPAILAWRRHEAPPAWAVACAGLSAFGPTIAAAVVAGPQRRLREAFGRWRTNVLWVLAALFTPLAVHLVATALDLATGGHPAHWLHLPETSENVGALIVFPIGEEFGWRGFLQPRMARRFGLVRGSLVVGVAWGLWHLAYSFMPPSGGFEPGALVLTMLELPPYAVLMAWALERSGGSLAVAIAFHAGAHLDHLEREPLTNLRLHGLHLGVVLVLAVAAAWSLAKGARGRAAPG